MPRTTKATKALNALGLGAGILVAMTAAGRLELGAVRPGEPLVLAAQAMSRTGQSCRHLASAVRLEDGSIQAMCTDGEKYRITTVNGVEISLNCSRARAMGITNC